MRRSQAWLGSLAFLVLVPGVVAGLVPWLITGWVPHQPEWPLPIRAAGAVLVGSGLAVLCWAFWSFATFGRGTPAPVAPPDRLVVRGPYAVVRNPMYVAVLGVVAGQGLLLGSWAVVGYAVALAAAFVAFVHGYEEPTMAARFGSDYDRYRAEVGRWLPRLSRTAARRDARSPGPPRTPSPRPRRRPGRRRSRPGTS